MLRRLNTIALIGSAITVLVCFWNRNEIPANVAFHPALDDEPQQKLVSRPAFSVNYDGIDYRVEPKYEYELYGMIVSYRQHDGESLMHRYSNDHLNMADVCVVWSDTAYSEHLGKLKFWNGIFTCNVQTSDRVAWSAFQMNQLSNNHLLSADPDIRRRAGSIRIGDQIRIKGWLSHYGAIRDGDGRSPQLRGTSTTRDDSGDGACETIFVNELEIIERASSGWRMAMYASLAILAATLAIHFSLPYRPYRK
jgi:hypothetical protein